MITIRPHYDVSKHLGERISKGITEEFTHSYRRKVTAVQYVTEDLKANESKIKRAVDRKIEQVGKRQHSMYVSYLQGLEKFLRDPSKSYQGDFHAHVELKTGLKQETERLTHSARLKALSEETIDIKEAEDNLYKGMWRHTGRMHKAFQLALKKQRVMDTTKPQARLFINKKEATANVYIKGDSVTYAVSVDLTIPGWEGQHADLMNALIVEPFAGHKVSNIGSQIEWKLLKKKGKEQLQSVQAKITQAQRELEALNKKKYSAKGRAYGAAKAEVEAKEREIKGLRVEYKQAVSITYETQKSKVGATGLMRFVAPETNRPFIQKLSTKAGKLVLRGIN